MLRISVMCMLLHLSSHVISYVLDVKWLVAVGPNTAASVNSTRKGVLDE